MNEKDRRTYLERYHEAKEHGVPFFPDVVFKDAVVSLLVFLVLLALAYFVGAPLEARANPADTSYTPRPEWYFLFLFQLLKYFPGQLEVVGAMVLPTLAIVLLAALPFLDRGPRRHFLHRPLVVIPVAFAFLGIGLLTVLAAREAAPPAEASKGDATAALYAQNCAACHGPSISVPPGVNLHNVIAQGKHEGMPAWGADLTTDQIDALAGFIVSPRGSALFTAHCGSCHAQPVLAAGNPLELRRVLDAGPDEAPHAGLNVPRWTEVLSAEERSALMNFLAAPDGQRLFAINCAACHGRAPGFSGSEDELRAIISKGGKHLDMPAWREQLSAADLDTLAQYVVSPAAAPAGADLFKQHCATCHGERVPVATDVAQARETIASGGEHATMPVWGEVLTPEQMDALIAYTLQAARGAPEQIGAELYAENCSPCHGDFGEGGPNPAQPSQIIVPISSAEFLKTRDDTTLRAIIAQGQPTFGMSPFGSAFGGPLDDEQIDGIVAFLRTWQANPPVELPAEASGAASALTGKQIYTQACSRCHGAEGEGGEGPALRDPAFQARVDDEGLFATIRDGHPATPMIPWGGILAPSQIQELVAFIRELGRAAAPAGTPVATPSGTPGAAPSFKTDVLPLLKEHCAACHTGDSGMGGWDASTYTSVVESGAHGPVVIAGDVEASLLAQKLQGTQETGMIMPPSGKLPDELIQVILDWIAAGAPEG